MSTVSWGNGQCGRQSRPDGIDRISSVRVSARNNTVGTVTGSGLQSAKMRLYAPPAMITPSPNSSSNCSGGRIASRATSAMRRSSPRMSVA
jgi:hypothetical protein